MYSNFYISFLFANISCPTYRHSDISSGCAVYYLAMMYEGSARIVCSENEITLTAGDVFFIPKGCRYNSYWFPAPLVSWASIGFEFAPFRENYALQIINANEDVRREIAELCKSGTTDCRSAGRLYLLLDKLLPDMKKQLPESKIPIMDKACEYMCAHPRAPVSDVANHCHISESGLYALFRNEGTTPAFRRQELMIQKALTLINTTDLSCEEISELTGFNSVSYFLRTLKKLTGKTTRELRSKTKI